VPYRKALALGPNGKRRIRSVSTRGYPSCEHELFLCEEESEGGQTVSTWKQVGRTDLRPKGNRLDKIQESTRNSHSSRVRRVPREGGEPVKTGTPTLEGEPLERGT
jgi:hypothetical protein